MFLCLSVFYPYFRAVKARDIILQYRKYILVWFCLCLRNVNLLLVNPQNYVLFQFSLRQSMFPVLHIKVLSHYWQSNFETSDLNIYLTQTAQKLAIFFPKFLM